MAEGAERGGVAPGALCPSCERFIGPADVCPYCDADSARSPLLRRLRLAALALAVLGVAFLYRMSAYRELPLTRLGTLSAAMNFAAVRVRGEAVYPPYVGESSGRVDYVSILLDDGSGRARVSASDAVARELVEGGRLPQKGEAAELTARVRTRRDGEVGLRLQAAGHLRTIRPGGGP